MVVTRKRLQQYDKALDINPDDYKAWVNKGNSLSALGRYEEALAACDKVLEIKPEDYKAWANKGIAGLI